MRKIFAVLAILALPACLDSGSDSVTMTPGGPDPIDTVANNAMGASLAGARGAGLGDIVYNPTVGRVAQDHAQDMFDRNYLSIYDLGTTGFAGPRGGEADLGDDLNAAGIAWDEIIQMVAQGEMDVPTLFAELQARDIGDGIEGNVGTQLQNALEFDDPYEFFGLGKAGTGAEQRWALFIVDPQ
jgi:hypothetical protein